MTAIIPGKAPNVLDNSGKVDPAMAGGIERLVDFLRVLAEAGVAAPEALAESCASVRSFTMRAEAKPGFVTIVGGEAGTGPGTGHRTQRPALSPMRSRRTSNSA